MATGNITRDSDRLVMARRQPLAPLSPTPLQDKPASLGAHTLTKPMGLGTTTVIRLKSSFHDSLLLALIRRRKMGRLSTGMVDVKESQRSGIRPCWLLSRVVERCRAMEFEIHVPDQHQRNRHSGTGISTHSTTLSSRKALELCVGLNRLC
jgi:hypothetical protein